MNYAAVRTSPFNTSGRVERTCERLRREANEKDYGGPAPNGHYLRRIRKGLPGEGEVLCVSLVPRNFPMKTCLDRYKRAKSVAATCKRIMNDILRQFPNIEDEIEDDFEGIFDDDNEFIDVTLDDARLDAWAEV
jgi:hypothetical protein